MSSRENQCHALIFLLLNLLAVNVHGRSWDLAVVIGREIDFYAQNGTLAGQTQIRDAVDLKAVTYDDITRTMFLSDTNSNSSIISYNLTETNVTSKPLLSKEESSRVISMVFDATTRNLFWIDGSKEAIMKVHVTVEGSPAEKPVVVQTLKNRIPRGIALDVCNSYIYWVNSNRTNPSVERSRFDGSERATIVQENMYEPLAVAIDHLEQKLYWIDDSEGIHFTIRRSNLNGSDRELILRYRHQEPVYLAIDRDSIYWSDRVSRAIWTMPKNATSGQLPKTFKNYFQSIRDADPAGIVTRDNVGKIDCAAIAKTQKKTKFANFALLLDNYNNLTTSTEDADAVTESSRYCLNDGEMDNKNAECHCKPGFSGARCETSLCHNYCLRGSCTINSRGMPQCKCEETFRGMRCEKDVCDGYCFHEGECSVESGKPKCKCKYSKGDRCEELDDIATICALLCARSHKDPSSFDTNPCRCSETNQTAEEIVTFSESVEYSTLLPIFSAVIAVLIILIVILSYYVNKLQRRPRIKKRIIVGKGVTPLTSRPQVPDDQCEITIENCCNMNICETPCFEPKLRTPGPRSNNTKKEEKNFLLDCMEGNSC